MPTIYESKLANRIPSIDITLSSATTPCQMGAGCNGNKGIHHFSQNSRAGASPSLSDYDEGLFPLQRYSRYSLQLQPTWLPSFDRWSVAKAESEQGIGISNNLRELDLGDKLIVASVLFPDVPGVYSEN